MVINERAKEEWEKKQAEIAKFQKANEVSIPAVFFI